MSVPRLNITEGMRKFLSYPRFAGPTRMLVLETEYFFDKSWVRTAETLGWQAASVSSAMRGGLTRDQVQSLFMTIGEFKPDFIITSNYAGMDIDGLLARFFEDAQIPYVSWFTDTPRMILYNRVVPASPYNIAATWERAFFPHFKALGFEHVLYMPHATDPALFNGEPANAHLRPLTFVGTSMIGEAEEAWEKLEAAPEVRDEVRYAFDEGRVTREAFADGVETILDPGILAIADTSSRRNAELCLVYESTRRLRADMVRRLDSYGMEVFGDPEWRQVTAKCRGGVGYFTDLAPFYRSSAINLNITSLQMKAAVNQRIFDCPAAGGFLITDMQGDLHELFDVEKEVVAYHSLDELEELLRRFRNHPSERAVIVRAAQRRIAAHHTHAHRLQSLDVFLRERFSG